MRTTHRRIYEAIAAGAGDRANRYIVPVAAGGGSDLVGRTVTERWGAVLGQSFVVDNQSGGGGAIACQTTAARRPRWLHPAAGLCGHPRHQPGHAQQGALRRRPTSRPWA
jgi:predicted outer membrane repeat protein